MVWRDRAVTGHPGVQAGWEQFIEHQSPHRSSTDKAEEFGGKLNEAASKYRETEAESSGTLKTFGDVVESYGGAIGRIAGGLAGGAGGAAGRSIGGVLGGAASGTAQE